MFCWRDERICLDRDSGMIRSKRENDLGFGWKHRVGAIRVQSREGMRDLKRVRKEEGDGDFSRLREMSMVRDADESGVGSPSSSMREKRSFADGDGIEMC